ncbi:MAG: alanine racemase [Eubacteriales bacterium]|nr:alanine racemase [Eubacteriales bacterium]
MKNYTRVYAPVDLDAAVWNMREMQARLPQKTKLIGVVKADAYGHGSVPIAKAIDPFVEGYAVACLEEALILRRHGVRKWILILGVTHESRYEELLNEDIYPAIFTMEQALPLSELAKKRGVKAKIHLALDTGMGRIGMTADEKGADLAAEIAGLDGIQAEGLFTHFARADEADKSFAEKQFADYIRFVELLEERGVHIPVRHCANSAAILELPRMGLDMARAGISMYGLYPSDEMDRETVRLKPVMGIKSFVSYVKDVGPGQTVSYGGTFVAGRPMRIATIPVGYGDGYPRNLSGKGYVLISGRRAPILGRICMDQFMVDVTGIEGVKTNTEVTLLGRDKTEEITAEMLAETGGGFHYEIICNIGKRIPRVYIQNGQIVGTKDYFDDRYEGFPSDED